MGEQKEKVSERVSRWFKEMTDNSLIRDMAQTQLLEIKLDEHMKSVELANMKVAYQYFKNKTAIQDKKVELDWKNNAKIETGLFQKLVRQKVNYLLALEPSVSLDGDDDGQEIIDSVFDQDFFKTVKTLGKEAVIKGVAYSIPYYDENGDLNLFKVPSEQIIPFWSDERRLTVDAFMRVYQNYIYESGIRREETVVEYWDENGITYYVLESGKLKLHPYIKPASHHQFLNENGEVIGLNWERVPLIAWRYNEEEESLLTQVKSLIDNLNRQSSVNSDILADLPKLIYVLKNYGGQDLSEFVQGLNTHFAIKVDAEGGVDTLQAEPQTTGAEAEIQRTRKAIYEAGGGIDTQDENLGNASGVSLRFRYSDLDLDCNDIENEFQQSIKHFMFFVDAHARNVHGHTINIDKFSYTFNRDIIINETEAITNARNSYRIIDDKTIRENHPWYTSKVESRLEDQNMNDRDVYGHNSKFPNQITDRIRSNRVGANDDQEE